MTSGMEAVNIQVHPDSLKELVVGSKRFRSTLDFQLSDYDLEICRKELKETDDVRNASLHKLRELLSNDTDIKYRTDEAYLLRFLRHRKFNCSEAYKYIRNLYTFRMDHPELFILSPILETLLNSEISYVLPYTTEEGFIVFFIKLGQWNPEEVHFPSLLLLFNLISDVMTMNPRTQITGVMDIFDLANVTISHASRVTHPSNIRLWAKIFADFYPWRMKRIVVVNCNTFLYATFVSIRYFLKKKIADRIIILRSDLSELKKYLNPNILPKEYGGNLDESECKTYFNRCLLDNLKYLDYEHSFIGVKKS